MRYTSEQLETWRREGVVMLPAFFAPDEVATVAKDFEVVFPDHQGAEQPVDKKVDGIGRFNERQFKNFDLVPFECSPALNLLPVHPALIELARAALGTDDVRLYQGQAWAKFTGEADFDQPFHQDFGNHTLTVPAADAQQNSITFLIYFTDVPEDLGPVHYVNKSDSDKVIASGFESETDLQRKLGQYERSGAAPAGSIFAYGIDVYHRGTNLTAPGGYRYAVTSCFKRAGNDAIGYSAWQYHQHRPWRIIFEHASVEQLACFGVQRPGDPFWTAETIAAAQRRRPEWDMTPWRDAL